MIYHSKFNSSDYKDFISDKAYPKLLMPSVIEVLNAL